ncbi:hypothetical protein FKW77_002785 [Venturia effusa]|uniref:1-phosphatidylinositol-3-phosphate 5-kinase n=1 Tax=Venturia effusa TaxID=50376 RepID=A0A517KZ87_9PEZI|nr:hypothetical protein FKW77_002785 [Venturia effusa]
MAPKLNDTPSPAPSSGAISRGNSRRPSGASYVSQPAVSKEKLSSALDEIHTNASRSGTLTTFDDFASPRPGSKGDGRGFAEDVVQSGFSGLYNRLKASVGAARDAVAGGTGSESADDASIKSGKARLAAIKGDGGGITASPITASTPSSTKLHSPLTTRFPEPQVPITHDPLPTPTVPIISKPSRPAGNASPILNIQNKPYPQVPGESLYSPNGAGTGSGSGSRTTPRQSEGGSAMNTREQDAQDSQLAKGKGRPIGQSVIDHQPDAMRAYRDADLAAASSDCAVLDLDQTPRTSTRTFERPNLTLETTTKSPINSHQPFSQSLDTQEGTSMQSESLPESYVTPPRPPLAQVSQSHLPGFRASRTNSSDGETSSAVTAARSRRPGPGPVQEHATNSSRGTDDRSTTISKMRSKILAKELWMRDENAKDCFYCGDTFSAFRRKHHCRICGNIFDAKCTSLVPGKNFGQSGRLRICKPCEAIVHGTDDDSSVYSDDLSLSGHPVSPRVPADYDQWQNAFSISSSDLRVGDDHMNIGTPTMGVPISRKAGESKRRSAVIEFDGNHNLPRPSSSRSLKSLSGRPRSSSHKRHNSRYGHQHMKSLKSFDDRAPFQRHDSETSHHGPSLPAFHHDNIIDPDLAAFLSDEGSSEEESQSIFATMSGDPSSPGKLESERAGFAGLLASVRLGKPWGAEKSTGAISVTSRDADNVSLSGRNPSRHGRKRNVSVSSAYRPRSSPRMTKSNSLLKGFMIGHGGGPPAPSSLPKTLPLPESNSKMMRSSSMRGDAAPAVELNQASLQHVRRLLRQMIQDADIVDSKRWERALMPILLQCTDDINLDIQRNDDIDIRHYIKLKKIPGGKPGDTSYISGVVFTKNLALKTMPRSIPNPRIALVTFPIEYTRYNQHFLSLDPVIAQEREYLRNLVTRIANLNPQVLLVEKNVSGLALEFLEEAGIAVVYNVKSSVLNAVARITQTKLITSPDKLTMDPSQLGKSASFDVKTYVHKTMKKTFVYFSGCQKELGCTIVLRGAEVKQLRKLKRITEFMCYVVYNLKLETCVMRDEYVLIPATLPGGTLKASNVNLPEDSSKSSHKSPPQSDGVLESKVSDNNSDEIGYEVPSDPEAAGSPKSPRMHDDDQAPSEHSLPGIPSFYNDVVEKHKTKIISASPFVKFAQPYLLAQAREQEAKLTELKRLRDQYAIIGEEQLDEKASEKFELVQPEMVHRLVEKPSKQVRDYLFAVHDAQYEKALHSYQTQKRQWELYLAGNSSLFDPTNHQRIAVLYSMVNFKTSSPCVGPDVIALSFYNEHDLDDNFLPDLTLGQYVEDLCRGVNEPCTANGCEEPLFNHHRQYVHGEGQMSVIVTKYPPRLRGMQNTILMWSVCRICGQETQVIPMSENTWKYSFGKYLELTFWSTGLHPRAHACPHDIHKNHVRYFGFNNVAVRIQWDPVELHEIIVPRATITWKVDSDLELKNDQYQKFKARLDRFMASVKHRIGSIQVDSVAHAKNENCRAEVARLIKKANEDHKALTKKLQEKYMNSRYYEIIPLNKAAKTIHEVSIEWDDIFAQFEKDFFPSEKDIRRLAEKQINNFLNRNASTTSIGSIEEGSEDVLTELKETPPITAAPSPELARRLSTTLSPEDTHNVLASVFKEDDKDASEPLTLPSPIANLSEIGGTTPQSAEAQMEAVERENVKHLDLAVPADLPPKPENSGDNGYFDSNETSSEVSHSTDSHMLELSPQVSNTVDQMRTGLGNTTPDSTSHETRIPRPAMPPPRVDARTSSPPLTRTRSQPQTATLMKRERHVEPNMNSSNSSLGVLGIRERLGNLVNNPAQAFDKRRGTGGSFRRSTSRSYIPRSVPGSQRNESKVLTLKQHFEQLSKEFEKQRMRERQQSIVRGRQQRAYPFASSTPIVDVYRDAHEAVQDQELSDDEGQTQARDSTSTGPEDSIVVPVRQDLEDIAESGEPMESQPQGEDAEIDLSQVDTLLQSDNEGGEGSDIESGNPEGMLDTGLETPMSPNDSQLDLHEFKHEKNSILKIITSFWSERSASGWSPLEYPFSANEHVWDSSDIVVREDEPSSLIALALSSPDYQAKVRSFRGLTEQNATEEQIEASIERNMLNTKSTNIKYAFENRGVRAQCKIFYAESFDALRRKCGIADRFVESISRSLKWDSKGGKTKSLFLKTLDDRFVLKSLSQIEVASFFKFAPNYFAFMHQNLFHQLPSVIAKMMGLFQITIRNPQSGLEFNWFMLVMENLFYDRTPNRRFDLKGSMRNRKIKSTGEADEVLLDENLVDIIFEKPIFVREHTMKLLKSSVWNDTLFLSKQNVMDYSLMAGFDDETKEIIVGVIDCIRTYTWDKKLETWIKDRGKNKPTVTSPKDYRNRFRVAMSKYILQAPNCWHQFQHQQIAGRPMASKTGRSGERSRSGSAGGELREEERWN